MFTGLVECLGTIESIENFGDARRFSVAVPGDEFLKEAIIGESISVNGTCLTAVELSERTFSIEAVEETMRRTSLGEKREGGRANLERAMRADARLGGHIVQGHVDGVGDIKTIRSEGESWWVTVEPPHEMMRLMVEKGSVCMDGISLTIANVAYSSFSVALIPHTWNVTTAGEWKPGVSINLEADVLAKHVERLLQWARAEH